MHLWRHPKSAFSFNYDYFHNFSIEHLKESWNPRIFDALPAHSPSFEVNALVNQFQFLLHDADLRFWPILFNLLRVREVLVLLVVMFVIAAFHRLLQELRDQVVFRQLVLVQILQMAIRRGRLLLPVILVHCLVNRFEASVPLSQVGRQRVKVRQVPFISLVPQDFEL